MNSFLICEAGASPQRRGRAHEEAICEQLMRKTQDSLAWLLEAGVDRTVADVLASPLGGTHKADIFFRAGSENFVAAGRLSAKMCSLSSFDKTQGYRNHLHGCGAGSSESFGLIPGPNATDNPARELMLSWQTGRSIMSMSEAERGEIQAWLQPRWASLCEKFLFGSLNAPGHGSVQAIICTIAKQSAGQLFSDQSFAMSRKTFQKIQLNTPLRPEFIDACGGCFADGIIALQARGSSTPGLQAKLNMAALIKTIDQMKSPSLIRA